MPQASRPHYHTRLNSTARADIRWWQCFLQGWNGVSLIPPRTPSIHVYSDASGSFGCGAFIDGCGWLQLRWPPSWQDYGIAAKEMVPVVATAATWGHRWHGTHVAFHVDNMAVVAVLQRQAPRDKLLMHMLRCLCLYAAAFGFEFSSTHIPGSQNIAADALSRNNLPLFSSLFPQVPFTPVPWEVEELLLHCPPDWSSQTWTRLFADSFMRVLHPPRQHHTAPVSGNT